MDPVFKIDGIEGLTRGELDGPRGPRPADSGFGDMLKDAIRDVDRLQHEAEAAQLAYAREEEVDLHDVLIKIEEADIAFKTMMEIRNKLVEAYRDVMRMSG